MISKQQCWHPSRAAALAQLEQFVANAGSRYASQRNFDHGQSRHYSVSTLSPWIRHRSITEEEVIAAVLKQHSRTAADKFIQEVFWRTYWKGWLEARPQVWHNYRADVSAFYRESPETIRQCDAATSDGTGIECFDTWCKELVATGYLHNHARMWFASIWIFTLQLPWQMGADFFLRHLLDGDPASNTLSWRWVAGLHTTGKTYLARPENIEKYTGGRFSPIGQLSSTAHAVTETPIGDKTELPVSSEITPDKTTGLLITEDDLCIDHLLKEAASHKLNVASVATLQTTALRSPGAVSDNATNFVQQLIKDCTTTQFNVRIDAAIDAISINSSKTPVAQVVNWASKNNLQQVVTAYAPTGPTAELIADIKLALNKQDVQLLSSVRQWDEKIWPHSSRGFFALKKKIPRLLDQLYPTQTSAIKQSLPF